jgi:tripartite-type tricarboxylate transporter receptor subunit TctC
LLQRLAALGFEPTSGTPEEFARYIDADVARGADLLRAARYEPQ